MGAAQTRACLGFAAGAIAALVFHQGLAEVFNMLGIGKHAAFRLVPTWPFGVPALVSLSFWGAMYGVVFALVAPRFSRPMWQVGIGLGLIAGCVTLFVVLPLKGYPFAHAGAVWPIARSLILTSSWGIGTALILRLLEPRPLHKPLSHSHAVRA